MGVVNYFAYGSNMLTQRLRERVGAVRVRGAGWIAGHELRFHKVSEDGSGKCDIHEIDSPARVVHGVVFEIDTRQKRSLDRFEGLGRGYDEKMVQISLHCGEVVRAVAYWATRRDCELRPYDWYHAIVVAGAREHRLPPSYLEELERVHSMVDPDRIRATKHLRLLEV